MEIKRRQRPNAIATLVQSRVQRRHIAVLLISTAVLAAALVGAYAERTWGLTHQLRLITALPHTGLTWLVAHLRARPERLIIDINQTDFQQLAYQRDVALAHGILIT